MGVLPQELSLSLIRMCNMLKEIIGNPSAWPAEVNELAQELHVMNAVYAQYAANFSHKLFIHQSKLGLDKEDIVKAIDSIALILCTVEDSSDIAMNVVISNQQSSLGIVPREDIVV
jgi:hypothetical protein